MMDFLQALEANICLMRLGRHMVPGASDSMNIISSTSSLLKVQFLLTGRDVSLTRSVGGAVKDNQNVNINNLHVPLAKHMSWT